jgi:hypothetical protein
MTSRHRPAAAAHADSQCRKEQAESKPPKSFRLLFQLIKQAIPEPGKPRQQADAPLTMPMEKMNNAENRSGIGIRSRQ